MGLLGARTPGGCVEPAGRCSSGGGGDALWSTAAGVRGGHRSGWARVRCASPKEDVRGPPLSPWPRSPKSNGDGHPKPLLEREEMKTASPGRSGGSRQVAGCADDTLLRGFRGRRDQASKAQSGVWRLPPGRPSRPPPTPPPGPRAPRRAPVLVRRSPPPSPRVRMHPPPPPPPDPRARPPPPRPPPRTCAAGRQGARLTRKPEVLSSRQRTRHTKQRVRKAEKSASCARSSRPSTASSARAPVRG